MKTRYAAGFLLGLALLPGCFVETEPEPNVGYVDGLLTVDWTIEGLKNVRDCDGMAADELDIFVTTPSGRVVGEYIAYCDEFETSIELEPGSYYADATLTDASGRARTTPVDLGRFTIYGDDELIVPIDFPFDSFY